MNDTSSRSAPPQPAMPVPARQLWKQRCGYGVADFSCNLIWQMITLYLMFFYTDVMGLPANQVGVLFLVTRIVDGVTDVAMGVVIDRTHTRWGKSRPYFLIGAVPFGVLGILAFWVPPLGPGGRLVYAYATYLALSVIYTVVNIPMASILPSLTSDAHERTVLATFRIMFSFVGATLVSALTLPMVGWFGGGSQAVGFFWTMVIFATAGAALFLVTFATVRERVSAAPEHFSLRGVFTCVRRNTPWMVFAVNILFMWGSFFFQQGALIYYFTYNVGDRGLAALVASITASVPIVGTLVTPFFSRRLLKRRVFMIASAVNLLGMAVMLAANTRHAGLLVGVVIASLGFGLRHGIYFSMQADPIDYGEWKTGFNAAGILSSLNGFIGKVAMAGAGAVSGALLTWGHYVPNGAQAPGALLAIKLNYLIIPAAMVVVSMAIMSFYNLDRIYPRIVAELAERNRSRCG